MPIVPAPFPSAPFTLEHGPPQNKTHSVLSGAARLPPRVEMEAWVASDAAARRRAASGPPPPGHPPTAGPGSAAEAAHCLDYRQLAYHRWLAGACGPDVSLTKDRRQLALIAAWVARWAAVVLGGWLRRGAGLLARSCRSCGGGHGWFGG